MDQRFHTLAAGVIGYSVSLRPGERVLIDIWDGADDLGRALIQAAYGAGGRPLVTQQSTPMTRSFILGADEEGMADWCRYQKQRMEEMDAYIVVRKKYNAYEYADIPAEQMNLYAKYHSKIHNEIRIPSTKWCVLRYPSPAMAQASGMSTEGFEDYYFKACCIDYRRLCKMVEPLAQLAARTDQVRIIAPGTDLRFSIQGLCNPVPRCGQRNVPCGETGMPVVPDSANGTIAYTFPSEYQGTVFHDVRLTLKDGVITEAQSSNRKRMNEILDSDPGARRIGEFAMGFNPFLTQPVLDTLFDEKMAKTIHFTPGNSEVNPSGIHWDLVTSHAAEYGGGEIWFDGVLVRKDGLFVPEELQPLNPEPLAAWLQGGDGGR